MVAAVPEIVWSESDRVKKANSSRNTVPVEHMAATYQVVPSFDRPLLYLLCSTSSQVSHFSESRYGFPRGCPRAHSRICIPLILWLQLQWYNGSWTTSQKNTLVSIVWSASYGCLYSWIEIMWVEFVSGWVYSQGQNHPFTKEGWGLQEWVKLNLHL